ncbi:MAG: hypothetical protein ACRD6U_06535 [Nitrososphaeraceae archaeon]
MYNGVGSTVLPTIVYATVNGSTSRRAGVTPIDPENVTNQTLQGYPTKDKNMSTGLEENE